MTVPEFQTFMLPLLHLLSDGQEHTMKNLTGVLAHEFQITPEESRELLPSGRQSRFENRVHWAATYLRSAGLIERTGYGRAQITKRGIGVLHSAPPKIDRKFLERFPEFREFRKRSSQTDSGAEKNYDTEQTPEEVLETQYHGLRRTLAQEILDRVKSCSPQFFEELVVDLLVAMGYGGSRSDAGNAVGRSRDDGIDGIIKEDKLGLDVVYIQAKRWEGTVGRQVVQAFAGSLEGQRARKGILITTSQFSQDALDYVNRIEKKIVLIDGEQLAQLMIDYGVGVTAKATYIVKRIDEDYFSG